MDIRPTGEALGARIFGVDLSKPVSDGDFTTILRALGEHGVIVFPRQTIETEDLVRFGKMFGDLEINVANLFHEPDHPEVMILSNIKKDGKPIGLGDAGQGWHTDMSYSKDIALANVLYALKVPMRDGRPLGDTQFRNMHAAYDDLPADIKKRVEGRTATHDFIKFWDMMRAKPGSTRGPLTPEQRARSRRWRSRSSADAPDHRAARSCTAIRATPCASTAWTRRRATNCSTRCSSIRSSPSSSTRTSGRRATC